MTEGPSGNPVVAQWQAELAQLQAANRGTLKKLAMSGIGPDPLMVLTDQIGCLMDSIAEAMGDVQGPQFKLLAQVRWQQRVAEHLENLETEGRKATLAAGARASQHDIDNLARASGLAVAHKGQRS